MDYQKVRGEGLGFECSWGHISKVFRYNIFDKDLGSSRRCGLQKVHLDILVYHIDREKKSRNCHHYVNDLVLLFMHSVFDYCS